MHTALLRVTAAVALAALPLAVSAASKPFPSMAGWDHTEPHGSPGRTSESYKKGSQLVTVLVDDQLSYDTTVDAVKKTIASGAKATIDRELTCGGKKAHEFEMNIGGTSIYRQLIINDSPGLTKVTYARGQDEKPANDAVAAMTGYCS